MLSPHIFRAYDIRGIYGIDFDEAGIQQIAVGYAWYLRQKSPHKHSFRVVLGRDGRISGESLEDAFALGLLQSGIDVVRIGMVTSPLLYFATCSDGFDGGVMITASHNPAKYNGVKLQTMGSKAICGEELQKILQRILSFHEKEEWEDEKHLQEYEYGIETTADFTEEYFSVLKSITNFPKTGTLVIDAGNGIAGKYAPEFFKRAGFQVHELYCDIDGNFPNHEADPERAENLTDLKKYVVEHHCDFGLAFDGDGDRIGVVDKCGNHFSADLLLLLLARDVLTRNPGATIVYDLKSTELLKEEIEKMGGIPVICKTGHSFVEEKIEETDALLAGEVSGHIFMTEQYFGFDDALLASAKLVEIAFSSQKTFTEIFAELPQTFVTPEIKISVSEDKKFQCIQRIVERLQKIYPDALTIDGIRIDFGERAWGIARASNTASYLTTRFEARSPEKLEEIQKIMNTVIEEEVNR